MLLMKIKFLGAAVPYRLVSTIERRLSELIGTSDSSDNR